MNIEIPTADATAAPETVATNTPSESTEAATSQVLEAPEIDFEADYIDVSELDKYDIPEVPKKPDNNNDILLKKLEALESKLSVRDNPEEEVSEDDNRTKKTKSKIDLLMERLDRQEREQKQREIAQVENRVEAVNQEVLKAYTEKRLSEALKKSFDISSPAGMYASNFILADLVNMVEEFEADTGRLIRPKEVHNICDQHWKKHAPAIVGSYKTRALVGETTTTPSDNNGNKLTAEQINVERQLTELATEVDKFHKMGAVERQNHKKEIDELNAKIKNLIDKKRLYKKP